jgi:hypothetical protein
MALVQDFTETGNSGSVPPQYENYNMQDGSTETYSGGVSGEIDSTQIKYLLGNDDLLANIESFLRGVRIDVNNPEKFVKVGTPKMNDTGINEVMQDLTMFTDKMFQIGKFEKEEIESRIRSIGRELIRKLVTKREKYDLRQEDIPFIFIAIIACVDATLKKSQEGNMQEFLRNNFKTIEHYNTRNKSLLGGLGGMFSRGQ